jgi:hypothetical protein
MALRMLRDKLASPPEAAATEAPVPKSPAMPAFALSRVLQNALKPQMPAVKAIAKDAAKQSTPAPQQAPQALAAAYGLAARTDTTSCYGTRHWKVSKSNGSETVVPKVNTWRSSPAQRRPWSRSSDVNSSVQREGGNDLAV